MINKNLKPSILKINSIKNSKILTLDNIKINNALNYNTLVNLKKEIKEFESNDKFYNLIIEGSNKVFSSGIDIKEVYYNNDIKFHENIFGELFNVCNLLQNSKKNTISYVNGISHGGANLLAFNCKYSMANEFSNMSFSGCKVGFTGFSSVFNNELKSKYKGFFKFLNLTGSVVSPALLQRNGVLDVYSSSKYISKIFDSYLEKDISKEDFKNFSLYHDLKQEANAEKILIKGNELIIEEEIKDYINRVFSVNDLKEVIESLLLSKIPFKDLIYEETMLNCPLSLFLTNIQFNTFENCNKFESLLLDYNLFDKMIHEGEYLIKFKDFISKSKLETQWKNKFNELDQNKIFEFFTDLKKEFN